MARRWNELMDLLAEHRLDEAALLCQQALERKPDDPAWLLGLSWALLGQGHELEALEHARMAAERDSENAAAFRTVAVVLLKLGRHEAALEAAQHAMHLDPDRTSHNLLTRIRDQLPNEAPAEPEDWDGGPTTMQRVVPSVDPDPSGTVLARARRHTAARAAQPPDAQLAALYGASLFGDWEQSLDAAANPGWTRYLAPLLSWRAIAVLSALVGIGGLTAGVVTTALRSSRATAREEATAQLEQKLRSGAVEQLAELLDSSQTAELPAALRRRAEATVYRFHDANPARLSPHDGDDYDNVVANALPLSRAERMPSIAELARVSENARDPQAAFLRADTLARAGDIDGARAALARANELEPSNVLHAAIQVELEVAAGRPAAAQNAAASALDINTYAPWTRVAARRARVDLPPAAEDNAGPVARAHLAFLDALAAYRDGDTETAAKHLERAIDLVAGESPFLLDWLDQALVEAPGLGRQLIDSSHWPETPAGVAARGRLLLVEGNTDAARAELQSAWQAGARDPLLAIALHQCDDDSLLEPALALWPHRFDLRIHLADTLSQRGELAAARERLDGVPVRRVGDSRLVSEAFTVLARLAVDGGDHQEAARLARRAIQKDDDNDAARALLESLSTGPKKTRKKKKKKSRRKRRKR